MPDFPRLSAILLAAGESRRMGQANKLLLDFGGEPLVRRTARAYLDAGLVEIVAVLGHEAEAVAAALVGLDLRTVVNADYRTGQMSSVHAGLAALAQPADGAMIALGDQPFLEAEDIRALAAAFARRGDKTILVPTWRGARGNPIVLAAEHTGGILEAAPNLGCRKLIERNPDLVCSAEMDSDRFVRDIDTEADYRALTERGAGGTGR